MHMVGRDATDEVRAFHSVETQKLMKRFQIGRIEEPWTDFVPPIQGGRFDQLSSKPTIDSTTPTKQDPSKRITQRNLEHDLELYPNLDLETQAAIITKYRELEQCSRNEGLYACSYGSYAIEATRYTLLALTSYIHLRIALYGFSGIFLGMLWHQLVFTVHDAGHMGITHDYHTDSLICILIANFLGGLSCCWWKQNHNTNHIVTNSVEHVPDIQHMPFFAVSHRFFQSLQSTYYDRIMTYDPVAKFFLRYQHYLYYPILTFGRFFLYFLGWQYIFGFQGPRKGPAWWHRYVEMVGQVFFWYWYGYHKSTNAIRSDVEQF